jgi:hypothetical protein
MHLFSPKAGIRPAIKRPYSLFEKGEGLLKLGVASALSVSVLLGQFAQVALAQNSNKTVPSGTLLLPLTPKLDVGEDTPSAIAPVPKKEKSKKVTVSSGASNANPASNSNAAAKAVVGPLEEAEVNVQAVPGSPAPPVEPPSALSNADPSKEKKAPTDPDEPDIESIEEANDSNSLLKGTVQIVADDTEYDQLKNTFLGTGSAVATIAGQNSRLEADMILYDQANEMLDARGNVKIIRDGSVSTGSSFKFKVSSDEYLITSPDTAVQGTQVVARTAYGNKNGLRFRQGTMEMPEPINISRNQYYGTMTSQYDAFNKTLHPDAYAPDHPSFVFKARKMVYEKYKESGNLTIFGGKLMFGKFGVPLGKFTATVGQESNVTFPVTPFISNNIMVGGINVGPMFNTALPNQRVFSWAPLVQYGGRGTSANAQKRGNVGAGFRLAFRGKKLSANLAYGSVSNILVGDVKYRYSSNTQFQGGINRFLPNGLFGSQRARAIAEFVDTRGIGGIPFLQGVSFRSSAGYASDNPALLNATPQYKQLFTIQNGNITNAFRLQEQVMTSSHPLVAFGNQKNGMTLNLFGGTAARAYSTSDTMLMGQVGPVASVYLSRLRLSASAMKSAVNGQSPFVFDQFIQGGKSSQLGGGFKVCKWLDIGGNLGYNMDNKMFYQKSFSAAIGPEDFKLLVTHDTIRGINRFGFNLNYGQPIPFNSLIMKNNPDMGQLAGGGSSGSHL